ESLNNSQASHESRFDVQALRMVSQKFLDNEASLRGRNTTVGRAIFPREFFTRHTHGHSIHKTVNVGGAYYIANAAFFILATLIEFHPTQCAGANWSCKDSNYNEYHSGIRFRSDPSETRQEPAYRNRATLGGANRPRASPLAVHAQQAAT